MSSTRRRGLWVFQETQKYTSVYQTLEKIGGGAYGRVYKCRRKTGSSEVRAVKVIDKAHFRDELGLFRHEISIMTKLDHPNVIKFHEFFEDAQRLYIVMELCQGGELFTFMRRKFTRRGCIHDHCRCLVPCCCLVKPKVYTEKEVSFWLRKVAEGLKYLHSLRIVHADLKPQNIMFVDIDTESELKIIDFGLASVVKKKHLIRGQDGTPEYMAPEVVQGRYTYHSDMWSFGCLMFTMLFGYSPFWTHSVYETYHLIVDHGFRTDSPTPGYDNSFPSYPKVSNSAKDLIVKLLQRDPVRRLTAAEALDHPWLTGMEATTSEIPRVAASLVKMQERTVLQRHVMSMIIDNLTEADLEEWKKSIPHIAKVGDKVSFKNLRSLLQHAKNLDINDVKTPVTVYRSRKSPEEFTIQTAQGVAEILDQSVHNGEIEESVLKTLSATAESSTNIDSFSNQDVESSNSNSDVTKSGVMRLKHQLEQIQRQSEAKEQSLRMENDGLSDDEGGSCWCFGRKKKRKERRSAQNTSTYNGSISSITTNEESGGGQKLRDIDWAAFNLREMLISSIEYRLMMKEERIWGAFDRIDADHDGQVGARELAQVFKIPVDEAQRIVEAADLNGDGAINLDEFISEFSKRDSSFSSKREADANDEQAGSTVTEAPHSTGVNVGASSSDISLVPHFEGDKTAKKDHVSKSLGAVASEQAFVNSISLHSDSDCPGSLPMLQQLPAPTVQIEVKPDSRSVDSFKRDAASTKPLTELKIDLGLGLDVNAPKASATNVRAVALGHYEAEATPISAELGRLQFSTASNAVPGLLARVVGVEPKQIKQNRLKSASTPTADSPQIPEETFEELRNASPEVKSNSDAKEADDTNDNLASPTNAGYRTVVGMSDVQLDDRAYIVGCPISSVLISTNGSPMSNTRKLHNGSRNDMDEVDDHPVPHLVGDVDQQKLLGYFSAKSH